MAKKNDGGAAFPHVEHNDDGSYYQGHVGMSLRQWFAGQAMAGLLANNHRYEYDDEYTKKAFMLADAMLKEREKEYKPAEIHVDGRLLDESETIAEALEKIE